MLKHLAILAVLLGVAPTMPGQPKKTADQKSQVGQDANLAIVGANAVIKEASSRADQPRASADPPKWYAAVERPDWWLVIIAGLTGGVIAWQSIETRRAATGAQKAADAALLNAQAVINAERPWIVMTIEPDKERPTLFRLKAVNRGRTPAAIMSVSDDCLIVEPGTPLLPRPEYSRKSSYKAPVMLVQGEYRTILEFSRDHLRAACSDLERFAQVEDCSRLTYVFGKVTYRDLLAPPGTDPHETRWCCMFWLMEEQDQFFFSEGSEEYTKHT